MSSGAVSATVTDGSATWYDPAGLGAIDRDQVDVSGTVYTLRFYSASDFIAARSGESDDLHVSAADAMAERVDGGDAVLQAGIAEPSQGGTGLELLLPGRLSSAHRLARDEPVDSLVFSSVFAVRYAFSDGTVNGLLGDPDASGSDWFSTREVSLRVHDLGLYVGSGLRF
jgi:hypothetical protein